MRKSRILYILLFILSLSFVYFYGGDIPYTLFYIVLILPFLSLAYSIITLIGFKYTQDINKLTAVKGEFLRYTLNISNESILVYPYINIEFINSRGLTAANTGSARLSVSPLSTNTCSFDMQCFYRGIHKIGIDRIIIEDLFGIFRLHYKVKKTKQVLVYPRILELSNLHVKKSFSSELHSIKNSIEEDNISISDVREYQYGDNIRKIHWKLTSKEDELMVRKSESTTETNIVIILDLVPFTFQTENNETIADIANEDKLVETATSIIFYCLKNGIQVNLLYYSTDFVSINAQDLNMFPQIYEILAKIEFNQDVPVKNILETYINSSMTRASILVMTQNPSFELCEELYRASGYGFDPELVYIMPQELTEEQTATNDSIVAHLRNSGISAHVINKIEDVKTVLEH